MYSRLLECIDTAEDATSSRKLAELAGVTLAIASFSLRWEPELTIDISKNPPEAKLVEGSRVRIPPRCSGTPTGIAMGRAAKVHREEE